MRTVTYTQEPDLDLVAFIGDLDKQRAAIMADYRATVVGLSFTEITIQPGEDTQCCVCEHPLPAGATGYRDKRDERDFDDSVLCVDCCEIELEAAGELTAGRTI